MITLFAALSAGAKIYLLCYLSIFLSSAFTERLGGCLHKCRCVVKLSILMSTMRKHSFLPFIKGMHADTFLFTPSFAIYLKCFFDNIPTLSKAKDKYRRMFKTQMSGNKTSSGEIGLDIGTHASPRVGQNQVPGGASVPIWNLAKLGKSQFR